MITLVPATEKHIPALHSMLNDPAVRREMSDDKPIDEATLKQVSEWLNQYGASQTSGVFVIIDDVGYIVGYAYYGYHGENNKNETAEIFVMVTRSSRAKGYGAEAIRQITNSVLKDVPLTYTNIKDTNYKALLAFESAGYAEESTTTRGRVRMVKHAKVN